MELFNTATDAVCFNEPAYSSNCKGNGDEDISYRLSLEYEDYNQLKSAYENSIQLVPRCEDSSLYYDMSGDKILIIFNHYVYDRTKHRRKSIPRVREGTYEDVKHLEKTFRSLGFMVFTHDDWKYKDILKFLTDVCKMDHSNTSCVAVAVMTHGKGSRLRAADRKYPVADITDTLRSAPSLAGKPKLFFIQACRAEHTRAIPEQNYGVPISLNADCLLLYSTYEDHFSFRDSDGSWMMQALCEVIDDHHDTMNLMQMVTLVNKMVATNGSEKYGKQMPVTEFNLKKFLKF